MWEVFKGPFPLAKTSSCGHTNSREAGKCSLAFCPKKGRVDFNGLLEFSATVGNSLGVMFLKSLSVIYAARHCANMWKRGELI